MRHCLSGRTLRLALVAVPLWMIGDLPARADDKSTDDELMESLDSELLEGLETLPAEDERDMANEAGSTDIATSDVDEFTRIGRRMRDLERMIPQLEKKQPATRLQKEVLADLEKLIAELEQQCQKKSGSCSGSSASQKTASRDEVKQPGKQSSSEGAKDSAQPARDSTDRLGKDDVRRPDMDEMQRLLKDVWGQLPAKTRDQMLQSSPEQFLPKYELLIEEYYRKLSEKQPR